MFFADPISLVFSILLSYPYFNNNSRISQEGIRGTTSPIKRRLTWQNWGIICRANAQRDGSVDTVLLF